MGELELPLRCRKLEPGCALTGANGSRSSASLRNLTVYHLRRRCEVSACDSGSKQGTCLTSHSCRRRLIGIGYQLTVSSGTATSHVSVSSAFACQNSVLRLSHSICHRIFDSSCAGRVAAFLRLGTGVSTCVSSFLFDSRVLAGLICFSSTSTVQTAYMLGGKDCPPQKRLLFCWSIVPCRCSSEWIIQLLTVLSRP